MKNPPTWLPIALLALAAITVPSFAVADLVCPMRESSMVTGLAAGEVIDLVLSTLLRKGVAVLLFGATTVVSLPWVVAGMATAAFYVPRRLRVWS